MTVAPSFAATYAWPVQVVQPVTVTNMTIPASVQLVLTCHVSAKGALIPMAVGTTPVPVTATSGGGFSYSGTISVPINPVAGLTVAPQAGNIASCVLRFANQAANQSSASTLTLP